jgi:hypothetical protein
MGGLCFVRAHPLLRVRLEVYQMRKQTVILLIALMPFACKVEKTGKDTYKVVAPTPEAKSAGEKAKEQAKAVGEEIKEGAAKAAKTAGGALEKAGEKMKSETAATETTATTSTTTTHKGQKTETRTKTTTRY